MVDFQIILFQPKKNQLCDVIFHKILKAMLFIPISVTSQMLLVLHLGNYKVTSFLYLIDLTLSPHEVDSVKSKSLLEIIQQLIPIFK
jgi:hypothetical protein